MFQAETRFRWGLIRLILAGLLLMASTTPAKARQIYSDNVSEIHDQIQDQLQIHDHDQIQDQIQDQLQNEDQNEHYIIDAPYADFVAGRLESPLEIFMNAQLALSAFAAKVGSDLNELTLTNWLKMSGPLDPAPEPYNRRLQFGTWRRDPTDGTCMDARATVLARASEIPVTTHPSSGGRCVVDTGRWTDPYNGKVFTDAAEVSIDHMVPLKNAYLAGAWRWDNQKRCQYFNFVNSPDHLLAVSIRENSSKGDDSPADYMPPIRNYRCQYLKSWLSVKAIWGLEMGGKEATAIREEVHQLGCKEGDLRISTKDVTKLRAVIAQGTAACPGARPPTGVPAASALLFRASASNSTSNSTSASASETIH